jgi:hypothetical protein
MTRLARLQILGPLALVAAITGAELAAIALAHDPSSEWLWYINLHMLLVFQRSQAVLSYYVDLQGAQFVLIALPLILLCGLGVLLKSKLPLALASNLSFVYAAFLVVAWNLGRSSPMQASLVEMSMPTGPGAYLISTLIISTLLSLAVSHALFLMAACGEKASA